MRPARNPLAVDGGLVLVLRPPADHVTDPAAPEAVAELERVGAALDTLDALDAAAVPGCWRSPCCVSRA